MAGLRMTLAIHAAPTTTTIRTRRRTARDSSGTRRTRSGGLAAAIRLALTLSAEVAWTLCFGVAVSPASVSIAIVAVVPVVAIIARSTALDVVEDDAEHSG